LHFSKDLSNITTNLWEVKEKKATRKKYQTGLRRP
jgi:hypothetical protein